MRNLIKSIYIQARNSKYPGYSECSKCGGNWGWKQSASHPTRLDSNGEEMQGVFLFCKECDKTVTLEERWEALDAWKVECICQIGAYFKHDSPGKVLSHVISILETEYIEFPRK